MSCLLLGSAASPSSGAIQAFDAPAASPLAVADAAGGRYSPEPERQIYLNAWFDWNGDGDWDDPEEHAVRGLAVSPADWAAGETSAWVTATFTVPLTVTDGLL